MSVIYATRLQAEPVRSSAFGSVTSSYTAIGTPFDNPIRIIMVQNLTDALLMFSIDGVHDHFPLPANGFLLLDIMSNNSGPAAGFFISQDTQVYVKKVGTPGTGSVYVSAFYGFSR